MQHTRTKMSKDSKIDFANKMPLPSTLSKETLEAMADIKRGVSEFIGEEYIASLVEKYFQSKKAKCKDV